MHSEAKLMLSNMLLSMCGLRPAILRSLESSTCQAGSSKYTNTNSVYLELRNNWKHWGKCVLKKKMKKENAMAWTTLELAPPPDFEG